MLSLPGSPEVRLDASDPTTLFTDAGKASPVTTDGDLVYTWEDKSGNGNDFQQATEANRPIYREGAVNGLDALEFDGSNDGIASSAIAALNTDIQTWLIVIRPDDRIITGEYVLGHAYTGGFGGAESTAINIGSINHTWFHYVRPYTDEYTAPRVASPTVVTWKWASDNTSTLWVNGAGGFEWLTGKTAVPTGHVRTALGQRSDWNGTGPFDGHICEVVGYTSALSDSDRWQAEQYLCDKWGLDHIKVTTSQSLYSGSSPDDWLGRATIVETDAGAWAAVYREAASHNYDSADELHIRFSEDEGATWGNKDTFTDAGAVTGFPISGTSTYGVQNPGMCKAPNGDLIIWAGEINSTPNVRGVQQYSSTDDGDTWSSDGQVNSDDEIIEMSDSCIVGSDIYAITYKDPGADGSPFKTALYKSADNGSTWSFVSDVTTVTDDTGEAGIVSLGGNNLLVVMRDSSGTPHTYMRLSDDLGSSWGSLLDITENVGLVHKPRLYNSLNVSGRVYMVGRSWGSPSRDDFTSLWYTDDDGTTWNGPYALHAEAVDCAYATVMQRTNSSREFYIWSYLGTTDDADIWEIEAKSYNEMSRSVVHPMPSYFRPV